jgi:lysophospholipase L1-like esterase
MSLDRKVAFVSPRLLVIASAAGWLAACSSGGSASSLDGGGMAIGLGSGGAGTGGATSPPRDGSGGASVASGSGGAMVGSGGTVGTGGALAPAPGSGGSPAGVAGMGGTSTASGGAAPATNTGDAGAPPPRPDAGAPPPRSDAGTTGAGGAPGYPPSPPSAGKPTIYVAGDSTVSTYSPAQAPQQGWGQRLQEFFTADVTVVNRAIGGRSSKSFIDEGHLTEILNVIKPGDYLFAQWGINDRSVAGPDRATDPATTFRTYLKQYIDGARSKNAIPILVTPTPRHQFVNGVFQNGFQAYCDAILAVGMETNTPVIDLQAKGLAYYTMIGDAMVSSVISLDALHFKAEGAYQMARLVAQGVKELDLPISPFVMESKL